MTHKKASAAASEHSAPPPSPAAGRAPRTRRLGYGLVLAGLSILVAGAALTGVRLLGHARSLQAHLGALEQLAGNGLGQVGPADLQAAGDHLSGMHRDLEDIEAQVGPLLPLGRLLGWIPVHGGDLAAAPDLLDVASGVAEAGDRAFRVLSPVLDQPAAGPGMALGEQVLPVLVAAGPELQAARQELSAAAAARSALDTARLSPRVAALLARLDGYLPWFGTALDAALVAPELLGAAGPRTYLVLAQNNDELRATGGFISGVGELRVENGRLVSLAFSDSYAVDNLEVPHQLTPDALRQTLFGELWLFRDANWDADFPTSARRALEIYARDRGVEAAGAIALDLVALRLLVDAVGPLRVEGIDAPVTGDNVVRLLREQWASPAGGPALDGGWNDEWWAHRKDFMGEVAGAALERLMAGDGIDAGQLLQALQRALDEKHLLVYLVEPGAAALLRDQNWDGALPDPAARQDLLLVVDSNVGFNKADATVSRAIAYRVDLGAGQGPEATATVTYRHGVQRPIGACLQEARYGESYADMTERCYWDYLRVYVPPGSTLLTGPNLALPPGSLLARNKPEAGESVSPVLSEGGLPVWAAFFDLEPGAERVLSFAYRLPAGVLVRQPDGTVRYRLQVQKQPGTEAVPFQLEIVLPPGAAVVEAAPDGLAAHLHLSTDLRTDREFEILYRITGSP